MSIADWFNQTVNNIGDWWKQKAAPAINQGLDWLTQNVAQPAANFGGKILEGIAGKDAGDALRSLPGITQQAYHGDVGGSLKRFGQTVLNVAPEIVGGVLGGPEGAAAAGQIKQQWRGAQNTGDKLKVGKRAYDAANTMMRKRSRAY
jgi:hypothetical protein